MRLIVAGGALLLGSCEGETSSFEPVVLGMSAEQGESSQTAIVGTAVPIAPSVRVVDADGQPVAGRRVVFFATRGDGSVQPSTPPITDADGVAAITSWTLGRFAGPQELTAGLADATADIRVVFTATATPAAPSSLDVGSQFRSQTVGDSFVITAVLRDSNGNVVTTPDVATYFSSVPAVATVSTAGLVEVLTPGTTAITVSRAGLGVAVTVTVSAPPSTFSATTTNVGGAPNGVAISNTNLAYVTHVAPVLVTRFDLPAEATAGTVAGTGYSLDVTFLPDGSRAYLGSGYQVIVVEAATHTAIDTIAIPGNVYRVLASADGQYVYVTTDDGWVSRISVASGTVTSITTNGQPINGIALHSTRSVLLATSVSGSLYEIGLASFTLLRTLTLGGDAQGLAVSPDGSRVFVAREGAPLDIRDGTTLVRLTTAATSVNAFDVKVTPDGLYLIVSSFSSVVVLDASSFVQHQSFPANGPRRIALNATGTLVMVATLGQVVLFLK